MSDWIVGRTGDPYHGGPPPLVDQRFGHGHIPPPLGAAGGHWSQPDLFNAFPGAQQHQPAWGGPGPAGGAGPWNAMAQMSPGPNNHNNGWTHGQYQPSPPTWQQRSPFEHPGAPPPWPMSAPAGGATGWEYPTGPHPGGFGGGAALGGVSDPITPGGFAGAGANHDPSAWGGPGNHNPWGEPGHSPGGWPNSAGANPQGGWLGPGAEAANQWAGPSSAGAWPGSWPGNSPHGYPHHPLSRSNSQNGGSKHHKGILKRSNSFGGHSPWSAHSPWLGEHGEFHEQKLAKRPRDWRADYTPRFGISSIIPGRDHSDVIEYSDSTRRTLNPLLAYTGSSSTPALLHDLRQDPSVSIQFPAIGRQHNSLDYAQLATNPPTNFMRLYHSKFPWYIDIEQSHPNGVTVHDVLGQLSQQMFKLITPRHFYNQVLGEGDRHQINNAFRERCQGHPELIARGVLHVDFFAIEGKFLWVGLAKGKNGMWEIKMR